MTLEFKPTKRRFNISIIREGMHINALVKDPNNVSDKWKLGWKDNDLSNEERIEIKGKIDELNKIGGWSTITPGEES